MPWEVSQKGLLLGMGNPLLDISAKVDQAMLDKYDLKGGNQILAEDKHKPLYDELKEIEGVEFIAGGATQNSIRVGQWMLQTTGATSYMGCVGKDDYADKMKEACAKDGVNCQYMVDEATPTGTCAVCIVDKERSLVANLSAANNYKVDHFKQEDHMALLEKAQVVYSAGFFITVCPEAIEICAKHCNEKGKTYCMNLSAPFIMEVPPFKECLTKTMPYVDFLFGNETEAGTFAKTEKWTETDIAEIAKKISLLPKEGDKPRTVVITQGCEPTIVAIKGEITEYPVIKLAPSKLVDTNGAGDAYVGGFLSGLVNGKDMHYCCQAGAYAASVIVQRSGCTFPAKPRFSYRPEPKPTPLRKPKFVKVKYAEPETKFLNMIVKVIKVSDVDGVTEALCGDETAVVTFKPQASKAAAFKEGAVLRIQNAYVKMDKGFVKVIIDKWGLAAVAEEDTPGGKPEIGDTKDSNNLSAVEYELKG